MKKFTLLLGLIISSSFGTFAQSPGGVSTNLTFWLKADNATTITGSPIQKWTTSGGSATGYNVSQATAANRPTLVNGATNSAQFNFNPSVQFTAAAQTQLYTTAYTPNLLGGNGTAIVVASQTGDTGSAFTYNCYSGSNSIFNRYQLKPSWRFQTANDRIGGVGYTFDWTAPTEYPTTAATIFASYGCGATAALRKNSVLTTTPTNASSTYYPGVQTGLYLGANNATEYTNSNVAEVILFNTTPSAADMDRVETYLSIKYGITRGGNTNTTSDYNYIASDGTVIWDKTLNSGFNSDIVAIGRDDNSGLIQKQSISVNNGEAVTIALGNGSIPTENTTNTNTFSGNRSFLTWGNNGAAKIFDATATRPVGITERLDRVWKTQATNFSQQTTFGFDTSQITGIGTMETLCLLFDDDGVDLSDATVVAAGSAINLTGSRIEFAGINIPAGKPYFTLANAIIPVFTQVAPICAGSTLSPLPTTSTNEITGMWSPSLDNTTTNTYTFTPAAGVSAITTTMTIAVNPAVTPTFNSIPPICSGISLSPLRTTSNEGISGFWSPTFDNTTSATYTFSPTSGSCINNQTMAITINPTPIFDEIELISDGAISYTLPIMSSNNIQGIWYPSTVTADNQIYTFIPTSSNTCYINKTFSLVNQKTIDAVDDSFTVAAIDAIALTPSVLSNDTVNFTTPALSPGAVTLSFVSFELVGGGLPSEADLAAVLADYQITHYSELLTTDGRYAMPFGICYNGTYLLTYTITSNECPNQSDTATATIIYTDHPDPSNIYSKKVENPKQTTLEQTTDAVTVYPNPSKNIFNIDLSTVKGDYDTVQVYSMLGTLVYEGNLKSKSVNEINLSNVTTGFYIAKVSGNSGNSSFQLIKQ